MKTHPLWDTNSFNLKDKQITLNYFLFTVNYTCTLKLPEGYKTCSSTEEYTLNNQYCVVYKFEYFNSNRLCSIVLVREPRRDVAIRSVLCSVCLRSTGIASCHSYLILLSPARGKNNNTNKNVFIMWTVAADIIDTHLFAKEIVFQRRV